MRCAGDPGLTAAWACARPKVCKGEATPGLDARLAVDAAPYEALRVGRIWAIDSALAVRGMGTCTRCSIGDPRA